jgi:hypothetical protein
MSADAPTAGGVVAGAAGVVASAGGEPAGAFGTFAVFLAILRDCLDFFSKS